MLVPFYDRVSETTTTTGTGTLTLAGAATGFRTFQSVMAAGDTCFYGISSSGGTEWEVGVGTLVTTTTLSRDSILSSSTGSAVSLSAGTKDVFITIPAAAMTTAGTQFAAPIAML